MKREAVLRMLSRHRAEIEHRFGVASLALFGSVARDEAGLESDIDLLVSFRRPPGFDGYMALKWHLEALLGQDVDLVMEGALRPETRSIVEADAFRVA